MALALKSLEGLAVRGVKAHAQPDEVFVGASLGEDKLVVSYRRHAFARSACKGISRLRLVTCERHWHDGDYVWLPVDEMTVTA